MKRLIILFFLVYSSTSIALSMPSFYGELKKVNVDGAIIAYYRFGQGTPLIMIPGHGDSMTTWHPALLQKLMQTHELVIFDFPGIGKSSLAGPYPDSIFKLVNLVHQFVKTQKFNKPNLLGFSMGGSVLLMLATVYGQAYGNLIAVGGKAGGPATVAPEKKYFAMLSNPKISPAKAVKTLLFPHDAQTQADHYLQAVMQLPQEAMNKAALQAQAKAVSDENHGPGIWDQLPKIKNNVLILNGTQDVLTPVINAQRISNAIAGSWLIRMKGAGHGVLFQEPDYCVKIINLFLQYQ